MMKQRMKVCGTTIAIGLCLVAAACIISPVSWSPDGRWLAFVHYIERAQPRGDQDWAAGSELWIAAPSSNERRRLAFTSGTLMSGPAWSSDGRTLYVAAVNEETSPKSVALWQVDLEGKRREICKLTADQDIGWAILSAPAISPDGRRVAFVQDKWAIAVVRSDGKLERKIATKEARATAWLPGSRWLVVEGDGDQDSPVAFHDMTTTDVRSLDAPFRSIARLPSRDNGFVAFKVQEDQEKENYFVSLLEGTPGGIREIEKFPTGVEVIGPLVPSPDGRFVFFAREAKDDTLAAVCRLDLKDGNIKVLYESYGAGCACWSLSPNGRLLAFREGYPEKGDGDESYVCVLDVQGSSEPIYLMGNEQQWASVIEGYVAEMKEVKPEQAESLQKRASGMFARADRLLSGFRRQYPNSPLLKESQAALDRVRVSLKSAGIDLESKTEKAK